MSAARGRGVLLPACGSPPSLPPFRAGAVACCCPPLPLRGERAGERGRLVRKPALVRLVIAIVVLVVLVRLRSARLARRRSAEQHRDDAGVARGAELCERGDRG